MKSLFVCFYRAYPPTIGAASVTFNCAKHAPAERWLIQVVPAEDARRTIDGLNIVTVAGQKGRAGKLISMPLAIRRITKFCRELDPDVVVLEGASWAAYHWLLLRQLRRLRLRAKIVYHAHNVEYVLRAQKHAWPVVAATRWAEARLLRGADRAFAVSEVDRKQFADLYGVETALLPNGIDVASFDNATPGASARLRIEHGLGEETVLFMGFYAYQPNREAIDFLVTDVFPHVLERRPQAQLVVIGSRVPYRRPWLINPGLIPHEDVPAFIKASTLGTAPIFSGSGTRLKILEYLAAGLPVVATAKGAEGLGLVGDRDLLLAESSLPFAEGIIDVLANRDLARRLADRGRRKVRDSYSYEKLIGDFYRSLMERGPASLSRCRA